MTDREEFSETIRIRLMQYLEHNRGATPDTVAHQTGYAYRTIIAFINGTGPSLLVAAALAEHFPDLSAGLCCPTCKRLL